MEAGSLTESFAENDLRAKVATEANELGQNATTLNLGKFLFIRHSEIQTSLKHTVHAAYGVGGALL